MSSSAPEEKAARLAAALNGLGHIAMGHPMDEARRSVGDAKLKEGLLEDATLVFDMVAREEKVGSAVIHQPAECKAALERFQELLRTLDFDDAMAMNQLKVHARQALEAFLGESMP